MPDHSTFELRFFFEWKAGCLWPGNEACYQRFDFGPFDDVLDCPLPLSPELLERCAKMTAWHDTSLNWDYPPDPGPWRQPECDRFNDAAAQLLTDLRLALGPEYRVLDCRILCTEDPELDMYLANPKGFRRSFGP